MGEGFGRLARESEFEHGTGHLALTDRGAEDFNQLTLVRGGVMASKWPIASRVAAVALP